MYVAPTRPDPDVAARLARGGDVRAFEEVYRVHAGRIRGLCVRMSGGDESLADDLTQEVFVRGWERIGEWRGDSTFATWLHRVAVNVLLTDRRTTARRLARVEPSAEAEGAGCSHPAGAGFDLERALGSLPDKARQVFVLHEVEGFGHDEVAEVMGTTAGTAKSQLHRARELLRRFLS